MGLYMCLLDFRHLIGIFNDVISFLKSRLHIANVYADLSSQVSTRIRIGKMTTLPMAAISPHSTPR